MPQIQIIINVYGGLVQDVFCSHPEAEVTLVDFDIHANCDDEPGIVMITAGQRTERAFVDQLSPQPLEALAGTDVERAIDAAALIEA